MSGCSYDDDAEAYDETVDFFTGRKMTEDAGLNDTLVRDCVSSKILPSLDLIVSREI